MQLVKLVSDRASVSMRARRDLLDGQLEVLNGLAEFIDFGFKGLDDEGVEVVEEFAVVVDFDGFGVGIGFCLSGFYGQESDEQAAAKQGIEDVRDGL